MPRIILKEPPQPANYKQLVQRLTEELSSSGSSPQPLILEQEIQATGSRHVHVIWDKWQDCTEEQRSDVIRDAYCRAEGDEASENISLASGATPKEAVILGLLPYKVEPTRSRHEAKPPMADYKKAMKAEAKKTVLGASADELRYPQLEDAERAKNRLEKVVPGWAVVQEIPYDG